MSQTTGAKIYVDEFVRSFRVDGVLWTVRAIWASPPEHHLGIHLMFECDAMVHRIRRYPADWKALDDEALGVLGECAA